MSSCKRGGRDDGVMNDAWESVVFQLLPSAKVCMSIIC